jgi:thiol-disulfide isomerase/thioredoxin
LKSAEGSKKHFLYFTEMADKYLYEPNSPVRNEELYIPVLETMIQTNLLSDTEKMLPKHRLKNAYKNRVNTKAVDFQYADRAGKTGSLYRIEAEYLLLFFNEPGCPSCKETIGSIRQSPVMNVFASEGRLKVLSIYTGKEVDEWKAHYGNYPSGWTNGYDRLQTIETLYDLRAIPTLYLLDRNKTVLLKDANFVAIENYLNRLRIL